MFNEYLDFLLKTLKFITVQEESDENAPFGKTNKECLDFVLQKSKEIGFSITYGDGYYGCADAGESGEPYYILGHLDVVPVGSGWTKDPGGEIADGKVYGRGVMDDKGPMLACLFAAAQLLEEYGAPKRKLRLIFGCNEESGWGCMDKYIADNGKPAEGFSPDGDFPVINCEKGMAYFSAEIKLPKGIKDISGGHRPNMVMDNAAATLCDGSIIEANGKSAHGSHPEQGDNAFIKLLTSLKDQYPTPFAKLLEVFGDYHGSGAGIDLFDDKSGRLTMNIGKAWTENDMLYFTLDIRYPVSYDCSLIENSLKKSLPDVNFTMTGGHDSLYFPPNSPLIKTLMQSYKNVTGLDAEPLAIGGGTYARAMTAGVAFGPQFPGTTATIHQKDEYAELEWLKTMYEIYYDAIKNAVY